MKVKIEGRSDFKGVEYWNGINTDRLLIHFRIDKKWTEKILDSFDTGEFIDIPFKEFISLKRGVK